MMKTKILVSLALFMIGCTDTNSKQAISHNEIRPSCLVEDGRTKEIVLCFEGELEYVEQKCTSSSRRTSKKRKNHPIVTFSEIEGCPKDRGYTGYCIMDGGEYIPYDYIEPSLNIVQKNKTMMEKMYQENCLRFGGEYHVR